MIIKLVKHLFHKQTILLFITFCIFSSCKLTGDFAITKRKHANGYYIETPSFVQNSINKSNHPTKRNHLPEEIETPVLADSDNTIATIVSINPAEKIKDDQIIYQANGTKESRFHIKPIEGNSTYKGTARDTGKVTHYIFPKRQVDGYSLIGFIVGLIDIPLTMAALTNGFMSSAVLLLILLQLLCTVFGFIGLQRIIKYESIGKGFAYSAILIGLTYLTLMFVLFIFLLSALFTGKL